ncbi:DEAD/DEAH box helicase, partial [Actinomyces gerencseriae]
MTAEPIAAPGLPDAFAPATRAWFGSVFPDGPTPVQERAWAAIDRGENALVIAPTGSGKTLAAFLSAIDRLVRDPPPGRGATRDGSPSGHGRRGVRVLYISPLKALGVDVERNLRRPLAGIAEAAAELGAPVVPVGVGVRSGDTPAAERRRLRTRPPDILITTPESLYLMLTSAVRRTLRTVETVIVDEVHSFAATKRGTHLALSLERLDDLLERPAQRIGLSATVAPREEIARFLGGARAVTIVADDGRTAPEVTVTVPVIDMARVPATADRRARMDRALAGPADAVRRERRGRPGRGDDARAWRSDRALRQALARGPDGVNGVDGAGSVSGAPTALLGTGADGGAGGADLGRMMQAAGDDPRGTEGTSLGASKADGETDDPRGTGGTDEAGGTGGAGGTDADGLAAAGPIGGESTDRTGRGRASRTTASIWPHIEEAILDQVLAHRTTLVFVNSRGACERLTAHLNEAHAMRVAAGVGAGSDADAEAGTGPGARAGGAAGDPRTTSAADAHGTSPASAGSAEPAPEFAGPAAGRARPATGPAPEPARPRPKPKPKAAAPARHHESWEMGETKRAQPLPADTPVIARAHHGSVSKEQRLAVERELKSGRLRCVVATASLELGIDMGAIDLVLQVAPPPSIASGLQRVGRADHRVGGRPHGIIYPIERTQLIDAAVAAEGMRAGAIERTALVPNALDVLAQQTVAAASVEDLDADDWYATVRRAAPYRELPRVSYDSVLELLAGGYASADLAGFAPRLVRDRDTGALTARPGAQRLAVTASGTIPDRGMFPVVLPEGAQDGGRRRVGELDEEMVNETAVGDIITLGTTSWRVREIGADRVVVDPAPGRSSRLPFWRGDGPGRPAATGAARGAFLREASAGLS